VQVTVESHDADTHNRITGADFDAFSRTVEGITKAMESGIQVTTNTTLTKDNAAGFGELIRFGASLGLKNMACNTLICSGKGIEERKHKGLTTDELKATLEDALGTAQENDVNLQWFSPTCYKHLNPVELGFGAKGCSAAAYNMMVQPDGTVLPCQSWPDSVGNILSDEWQAIWRHPTCRKLREHGHVNDREECVECLHNEVCGGGCPLEYGNERNVE
jgi:radical SAM protein with 4Fe4S-binding SPASM domain